MGGGKRQGGVGEWRGRTGEGVEELDDGVSGLEQPLLSEVGGKAWLLW